MEIITLIFSLGFAVAFYPSCVKVEFFYLKCPQDMDPGY